MSRKRKDLFLSSRSELHFSFCRELLHAKTMRARHSSIIEEAKLCTMGDDIQSSLRDFVFGLSAESERNMIRQKPLMRKARK